MGMRALVFAALLLCPWPAAGQTNAAAPPAAKTALQADRAVSYTAWDDDYFYVAVQVDKPTLHGKNVAPFSNPREDDAVLITFQTDDDRNSTQPNNHTVMAAASAMGGAQIYVGADLHPLFASFKAFQDQLQNILDNEKDVNKREEKRTALLGRIMKFQVVQKGTLRTVTNVNSPGYTVEIAIPWSDLGGKPLPGARMGFNVTTQSTSPDSPAVMSLSPQVKSHDAIENPSLWGEIVFLAAPNASIRGQIACPRVVSNKPVIDGEVHSGEWNDLSGFTFDASGAGGGDAATHTREARVRPDFTPRPPRPVVPIPAPPVLTAPAPHKPQPLPHLVLARYEYNYQADPRKSAPMQGVAQEEGGTLLSHHPLDGAGPWFSYDRADWHLRQLIDARQAGIDVLLPVYRGAARDRRGYADKGLLALRAALQQLRAAGQDYPQIGLSLDATDLTEDNDGKPVSPTRLYALIRRFYRAIPAPFRFTVQLSRENSDRPACPIFLSGVSALADLNDRFAADLRARFARDFSGMDLLILGTSDFKGRTALDGYYAPTIDKGFQMIDGGWIKAASVGPGFDGAMVASTAFRSRRHGDAYRDAWKTALNSAPDWVLVDGWNDYASASEIAPTFETGYSAVDITREYVIHRNVLDRREVRFISHNAPSRMQSGETCRVTLRVQNCGAVVWGASNGLLPAVWAYRWRRDGAEVGRGSASLPPGQILGGQNVEADIPVRAVGSEGAPLPSGDYVLEFGVARKGRDEAGVWLGGDAPGTRIEIPVHIEAGEDRPWSAALIADDLPSMLETGGVYPVRAVLRNDGPVAWSKGTRITPRIYRIAPGEEELLTPVSTADASAVLDQETPPGQTVEVHLSLPLTDPAGAPLPVWSQNDAWTYAVVWEAANESGKGATTAPTPTAVIDEDFGIHFLSTTIPAALPAERRLPVKLSVQNVGPQTWKQGVVRLGYHWYYQDGTEFVFEDETTPIQQDMKPGDKAIDLLAWVTPPPWDGVYYLVWDLKVGDAWASTTAATRPFDEIVQPVKVINGKLTFVDLSTAFNLDGITDEDAPQNGNFDFQGHTFPADVMPPYALSNLVPDALWRIDRRSGPDSRRRISFQWGHKDPGDKNFIACQGQRIELGKSSSVCHYLHIVAATTGKSIATNIKLIFQEPTEQSEDLYAFFTDGWDKPAGHEEIIAFQSQRRNSLQGSQPDPAALYHYTIKVPEPRKLVAIQLPDEPAIRIAAITIEK